MVRYPQNSPSEPPKPQAQPVIPKVVKNIKDGQAPEPVSPKIIKDKIDEQIPKPVLPEIVKEVKDEKVEQLQQRLYSLEKKLKDIEQQGKDHAVEVKTSIQLQEKQVNFWDRYRTVFIIASILGALSLLAWVLMDHLYVAAVSLELNPKGSNLQGEENDLSGVNFVKSDEPINEALKLYLMQVRAGQNGRSFEARVYSFGPERTGQIAENWEKDFSQKYMEYRKEILTDRLNAVNKEHGQIQGQLEDVFEKMSGYKTSEEYFLVNASSKEKLIQLAKHDALDLEKELIDIKDQLANSSKNRYLYKWSPENKVLLGTCRIKLVDVEFKKFLVGSDFSNIYEEGIRTIKSDAAQLINDQAQKEGLDEIAASLIIKDFFLSCRQEAIEAVLNKRYVISDDEVSGRLAEYIRLKDKFEGLNLKLASISLAGKQIREILQKGLDREVVLRSPLKVVKY